MVKRSKTIPVFLDTNFFAFAAENSRFKSFIFKLKSSNNVMAHSLASSLEKKNIIRNMSSFVEFSGIKQKDINLKLEVFTDSVNDKAKLLIDPFREWYHFSEKKLQDKAQLTICFNRVWTILASSYVEYLSGVPELYPDQILGRMKTTEKRIKDSSPLFKKEINYVKSGLIKIREWEKLLKDLSIEAVSRYGIKLLEKIYPNDKELSELWQQHVAFTYFSFWDDNKNKSAYRIISNKLDVLRKKHGADFFPADKLRPHNDTLDGHLVHALGFGWFFGKRGFRPVFGVTTDSFDTVLDRIKQYLGILIYFKNPLSKEESVKSRVNSINPGTLFCCDEKMDKMRVVQFYQPEILIDDDNVITVKVHHSEIDGIQLLV